MSALPPLTPRQQMAMDFIRDYVHTHRFPLSVREVAEGCGLSGPSAVTYQLRQLRDKGYLTLTPGTQRGMVIADTGEVTVSRADLRLVLGGGDGGAREAARARLEEAAGGA